MPFDSAYSPSVGGSTKVSEYQKLRDNDKALAGGDVYDFGGSIGAFVTDTDWVDLPDSWELEMYAQDRSGRSVYLEVNVLARMADGSAWSGTVTASLRLFNLTAGAAVASSQVDIVLSVADTRTRSLSSTLTLSATTDRHKIQIKTSAAARMVAGRARVVIR